MPSANGAFICVQLSADLLPGHVVDVAVAENHALVDIGNGVHRRPNLPFQINEGVNLAVHDLFQVHDFLQTPHEGCIRVAGGLNFLFPRWGRDAAGHFPKAADFLNVGVDALVEAVSLTEIFLCGHPTFFSKLSSISFVLL